MPASIVKSKHADTSGTGPVTSITATFDSGGSATAGNYLVALYVAQNVPTITPPSGWTAGPTTNITGNVVIASWYKVAAGGETSVTVTIATAAQQDLTLLELSGVSAFDLGNSSSGSGSSLASASISTTTPGIVLAAFGQGYNATSGFTLSNSFTKIADRAGWYVDGYRVTTTSGSYSTTASWTGSAQTVSVILGFKETTATPVSKTLTALYNVRAVASKSLITLYNVRAFTNKSLITLWSVRSIIGVPRTYLWHTRTGIGKPLTAQWNVAALAQATKTLSTLWTTRGTATKGLSTLWGVGGFVNKSLVATWGVRTPVSKSLTTLYTVRAVAPKSIIARWNTIGIANKPLSAVWGTRTTVTGAHSYLWHTRLSVSKPLTVQWVVEALVLVNKSLIVRWNVFEPPAPPQIFIPTFISIQDTISKSHRKTARIVVYDSINGKQVYASDDLLIPGGLLTGGVNFANSTIRRRASLSFIDRTGALTPGAVGDIFSTFGHVFKVWRGVVVNGINHDFPLGAFSITDVSVDDSGPGVQISVNGYDYGDLLGRRGLVQDHSIAKGTNFGEAIQALISQQAPGIQFNFETTTHTTPALFFQTNANPWEIAVMMAKAIGCDLFFDQEGICTMRSVPDYSVVPVGYTYDEGATSTSLYVNKRYTNRDAYNYFIVTGEHSGNATTGGGGPIRGDAYDDNPNSKTYWKGPYGTVPAPPVSSKLVTSQAQAEQAARGLLQNSIGRAERLHFNAIVNPRHEVGDVIQFTRAKSKINARYVIDSGYIPLGHDQPMDLTTRVRQALA